MKQALLILVSLSLFSCATLNSREKAELRTMMATEMYVEEKNPKTAAVLGILPGFGSFYTRQYGLGVVDLLLWPISILWDPVAGHEGALAINYAETKAYAKRDMGKEISELDERLLRKEVDDSEYLIQKRIIENRYSFD